MRSVMAVMAVMAVTADADGSAQVRKPTGEAAIRGPRAARGPGTLALATNTAARREHARKVAAHPMTRNQMTMLDIRTVTWALSAFTLISYLVCVLYGLVTPPGLHMKQFLEIVLPGFRWLTLGGFLVGVIESFLWGAYVGLVFVPIYNAVARRRA